MFAATMFYAALMPLHAADIATLLAARHAILFARRRCFRYASR